jgi:hypothetical protein
VVANRASARARRRCRQRLANPDEDVIASDDRVSFSGPSELGRILERVLVADSSRRPSVQETVDEFKRLVMQWGVRL